MGYSGNHTPPGKAGQQPVPSVACRTERSGPRSVHREYVGRVIEPRKPFLRGSRRRLTSGRQHFKAAMTWQRSPPGSKSRACRQRIPQELGRPCHFRRQQRGWGSHEPKNPGPEMECRHSWEIRRIGTRVVPPNEGNEARRDGWQGVGAARSSDEGGEPIRGTRRSQGAAGTRNRWRERWRERRFSAPSQRNNNG